MNLDDPNVLDLTNAIDISEYMTVDGFDVPEAYEEPEDYMHTLKDAPDSVSFTITMSDVNLYMVAMLYGYVDLGRYMMLSGGKIYRKPWMKPLIHKGKK